MTREEIKQYAIDEAKVEKYRNGEPVEVQE